MNRATADELMWGGYLKFLVLTGTVTAETPTHEVEQMRAEFIAGLHSDAEVDL